MAQEVPYYADNITYEEGPFVLVYAGGYRIEAELKGHHCPVLPDVSILHLIEAQFGDSCKSDNKQEIARRVDWLNEMVRAGEVVLRGKSWVAP